MADQHLSRLYPSAAALLRHHSIPSFLGLGHYPWCAIQPQTDVMNFLAVCGKSNRTSYD
jgi:hypothetical protein